MQVDEFDTLVHVAAHFGASFEADARLVRKVRTMTGPDSSLRFIAAATLFHCWLLRGRPGKEGWRYLARVQYARDVMGHFMALPEGTRRSLSFKGLANRLEQTSAVALN